MSHRQDSHPPLRDLGADGFNEVRQGAEIERADA